MYVLYIPSDAILNYISYILSTPITNVYSDDDDNNNDVDDNNNNNNCLLYTSGQKLNTAEKYEIYKHHTTQPNNILNDQLQYKSHTLFDTIIQKTNNNLDPRINPLPPHATPTIRLKIKTFTS